MWKRMIPVKHQQEFKLGTQTLGAYPCCLVTPGQVTAPISVCFLLRETMMTRTISYGSAKSLDRVDIKEQTEGLARSQTSLIIYHFILLIYHSQTWIQLWQKILPRLFFFFDDESPLRCVRSIFKIEGAQQRRKRFSVSTQKPHPTTSAKVSPSLNPSSPFFSFAFFRVLLTIYNCPAVLPLWF